MVKAMPITLTNIRLVKRLFPMRVWLKAAHGQLCSVTYK